MSLRHQVVTQKRTFPAPGLRSVYKSYSPHHQEDQTICFLPVSIVFHRRLGVVHHIPDSEGPGAEWNASATAGAMETCLGRQASPEHAGEGTDHASSNGGIP